MGGLTIEDPIHFIGVGGTGMSALAELAMRAGLKVQGSDAKTSPMLARLARLGARVATGHDSAALGKARTVVYSTAIGQDNVELAEARSRGLKLLHRSDFLCSLMTGKTSITIAGTHGKTTTAAMVTHVLDALGADPSAAIGGIMLRHGSTARYGHGELFVAEADESDGTFLKYQPFIGVLTNVAMDHMDYFKDEDRLVQAFRDYLGHIAPDGVAIVGWDNPLSRRVGGEHAGNRLTYGFLLGSEVRALDYHCENGETRFAAVVERDRVTCRLPAMGRHNVQNALCALAVARALELDVPRAAAALADFPGVARRMSRVVDADDLRIFDDYAHNPGKIAACVRTLKDAFPGSALHVVYQPHRYSRLETMYDEMLRALEGADYVHVVPVYSAGETTAKDFSPVRLAQDLTRRFPVHALACANLDDAVQSVVRLLARPAVVLTVGAGDVTRVATQLKERLFG